MAWFFVVETEACGAQEPGAPGRPRATTALEITSASLALFDRNGYDETTVEDIARAAGISRRTLFRYFPSKHDIVWGDFATQVARFRAALHDSPAEERPLQALRRCVVDFNDYGADAMPELFTRMRLITTVPALQGHAMLRHREWCDAIAEFVAERTGASPTDLLPAVVAQTALGISTATFRVWIADGGDLLDLLDRAFQLLASGFPMPSTPATPDTRTAASRQRPA